jgi:hypothetical protein
MAQSVMGERRVQQDALFYEFSLERHVLEKHFAAIDRFVESGVDNLLDTCGAIKERRTAFPAPNKELLARPKEQLADRVPSHGGKPLDRKSPYKSVYAVVFSIPSEMATGVRGWVGGTVRRDSQASQRRAGWYGRFLWLLVRRRGERR